MRRSRKRQARSGHYDTRVVVYRQDPDEAANSDGEIPEDAMEFCRRWAEVIPLRGRLQEAGTALEGNITHVVRMHYDEDTATITPQNWIVVTTTSQRLNIVAAIDLDNRRRTMELECTERVKE